MSDKFKMLNLALLIFALISWSFKPAWSEDEKEKSSEPPEEIVVTASRHEMKIFESPYLTSVISAEKIQSQQISRSTPEIFSTDPSAGVQKTSQGQGSPYLRGFTGFRNLFLIDGIRLNNSAFRDGPNEYWNTVDTFTIGKLEIVKGPSSALYGSDAVGGTVNALTPSAREKGWHSRLVQRSASADSSSVTRLETSGQFNSLGLFAGVSFKDFDDLNGGRHIGLQEKTGYREQDYDIKVEYAFGDNDKLTLLHQNVNQPDVWRTHATIYGISWRDTARGTDKERSLDHTRQLSYVQYDKREAGWLGDKIKFSLSYHLQNEEQFRIKSNNEREKQGFQVGAAGFFAQAERKSPLGLFSYGAEFYRDNVNSSFRKYKADGSLKSIEIQGSVADNATYDLFGAYLQNEYSLSSKSNLTAGLRYTKADVEADKVYDPVTKQQISLSDNWSNVVGNLRVSHLPNENWHIFGGISQGFRAPNLSDLSRLDIALSGEIETPSPGLKPEYYTNIESGFKTRAGRFNLQSALFYTVIRDMIVRYRTGNIISGSNEVQKANSGDGFMSGGEIHTTFQIDKQWSVIGAAGWQRGEVDTYLNTGLVKERKPMTMIPPPSILLGLRWAESSGDRWVETNVKIADRQDRLSPLDKLNTQRIPPDGTPGYTIYTFSGGLKVNQHLDLSAKVENITNRDYRTHGSGNNEAGTNFILSLDAQF